LGTAFILRAISFPEADKTGLPYSYRDNRMLQAVRLYTGKNEKESDAGHCLNAGFIV
jgi:hypothetical protein